MRLLFITSAYPAHGDDPRGLFIAQLAQALRDHDVRVTVLAPGAPDAPETEELNGVTVHRATYWLRRSQRLATGFGGIVPNVRRRPWLAVQIPPLVAALIRAARRLAADADIVHAHWLYPAGIAAVLAGRRHGVPVVVTSHGTDLALAQRSRVIRGVSRWVAARADACVAVSHAIAGGFTTLGVERSRVHFLPLGVSLDGPPPEPEATADEALRRFRAAPFRIVYVGRLIAPKGVDTLLEAHARLEGRGHTIATALVGAGPEERRLRAQVRRLDSRNVLFAGGQSPSATQRWIAAADVLVLPSWSEGRGIVIAEAGARQVPAVASDIPGPRELIRDGVTGLLFPLKDAARLAEALERLLTNPEERAAMGRRAREFVVRERLTMDETARGHVDLYRRLLAAR